MKIQSEIRECILNIELKGPKGFDDLEYRRLDLDHFRCFTVRGNGDKKGIRYWGTGIIWLLFSKMLD